MRCLLVAGLLLAVTGCGAGGGTAAGSDRTEITVFAAASLTEAFTVLGRQFTDQHPGTRVRFSFESSATLARQIVQGAPADVFAAANPETMAAVTEAGVVFARNRLVIAVPPGNPGKVRGLADLARPELTVALCAPQVPCGAASATALRAAELTARPDTYEKDVKAVLAKLRLGEVDAGLVYRTDVLAAGGAVTGIDFPEAARAVNDYMIAVLPDAPAAAEDFVRFVRTSPGRSVLAKAGFELP